MAYNPLDYIPGLYEFYLPFLIVFAVIYALVDKAKIFGESKAGRVANLVLSMGSALMIAPIASPFMTYLVSLFGGTLVVVLAIIAAMIITFAIPFFKEEEVKGYSKYILAFGVIVGLLLFFNAGGADLLGLLTLGGGINMDSGTVAGIIMIGITILIIFFLLYEGKGKKD